MDVQVDDYLNSINTINANSVYDKMVASLDVSNDVPEFASELVMA